MEYLQLHIGSYLTLIAIFGLVVGSFLNVVIYRLPIMLKSQWHKQCKIFLGMEDTEISKKRLNFIWPPSHCPKCQHPLKFYHNIPIFSFLFLRGCCAYCKKPIFLQYPIVEVITLVCSLLVAFQFLPLYQTILLLLLTYALIVLSFIDINEQILPDSLTMSFLWLGLLANCFNSFVPLTSAIFGVVIAYSSLWVVNTVFRALKGNEGMGSGDFKMFAMLGAWFGWQSLPMILFIAAFLGLVINLGYIWRKKLRSDLPIPFGPYLAIGGFIVAIWGPKLLSLSQGIAS